MGKISIYRKRKDDELRARAFDLYKEGLSLRKVASHIGRSYQWVWTAVKEREQQNNPSSSSTS